MLESRALHNKNIQLAQDITQIEHKTEELKTHIDDWKKHPWNQEKIARQELQLGYPNEHVILF